MLRMAKISDWNSQIKEVKYQDYGVHGGVFDMVKNAN